MTFLVRIFWLIYEARKREARNGPKLVYDQVRVYIEELFTRLVRPAV